MNIDIVVYSKTRHTLAVATALRERLATLGHGASLIRLGAEAADLDRCEGLVLASPVHGGLPAAEMKAYLEQVSSLQGKKVACLVTGFFPPNLGRNQALAYLMSACEAKGARIGALGSVGWASLSRRRQIADVVAALASCFQSA
jgi:multimeric flavodoxin WrbA